MWRPVPSLGQFLADGGRSWIIMRTVSQVMKLHVAYELTPMGKSLLPATAPLIEWTSQHLAGIDHAREEYDTRTQAQPAAVAR